LVKTPGSVKRKIKTLRHRHLKNLYKRGLERAVRNCRHFGYRRAIDGSETFRVGMCLLPCEDGGFQFCQHMDDVEECPDFELAQTKEEIKAEFNKIMENPDLLAKCYRDLYVLEWVLDGEPRDAGMWGRLWQRLTRREQGNPSSPSSE